MKKLWADRAWDDYLYWQTQDKKTLKRINELIKSIEREGLSQGILTPRLFSKLGIKRPTWEIDPLGNSFGAGGLFLTLSELHKIGLFYLNKGKWNGKQILSEKWIAESTKAADVGHSGYLFWRGEYDSFRADGKYSQISMILPQKNAVVSFVFFSAENPSPLSILLS